MHADVAWQDSGGLSTITRTQTPTRKHFQTNCWLNKKCSTFLVAMLGLNLNSYLVCVTPHLCWGVPRTCCRGIPPPAWRWSSPPAAGWGACPVGWQRGIRSRTWASAVPLSWWDEVSGRTLWWSRALSIQKEGHIEHAQHRSLETQREMNVWIESREGKQRSNSEEEDQSEESGVIICLVPKCLVCEKARTKHFCTFEAGLLIGHVPNLSKTYSGAIFHMWSIHTYSCTGFLLNPNVQWEKINCSESPNSFIHNTPFPFIFQARISCYYAVIDYECDEYLLTK